MATTKRILQAPTLNNSGQITGGSSAPGGYLRKLPNELPGGDGPNSVRVIQTPQTNDSGSVTGGNGVRTGTNTAEDPSTYNFTSITGVKQNTGNSALLSTGKTGTTNNLAGGRTDSLPGVTKYAGNDKLYGNNRAGIDLVNSQSSSEILSEGEKAQRLAGAYNPVPLPTVATTQNPVIKKTLPKEETPVKPDIQAMDLPTIQENIDRLTYKVNSGKSLTEDEFVTFNQLRRQATEMMKPQSLTGGLDSLMQQQQNEITTTQQTQEAQNKADLEAFTKSQEAYKASQLAMIEKEEELSRQRMAAIFGATGQDSSTDTINSFGQMEQNYSLQKQAKIEEVQAKIDLFESQQRKDSAETIQKMKDRLYNTQLKAAEFDVANLQEINKFNQEQAKSTIEKLDNLKAMSDSILASSTPLTEEQKQQAAVIGQFLVDPDGGLNQALLESYKKTNPNLIPYALSMAVGERNKIQENKLAMQGLDADIKKAQLNKLLNPEKPDETFTYEDNGDGTFTAKGNRGTFRTVDSSGGVITSKTSGGVPISQAIQTALEKCKTGAQCGKFVNDILEGVGYGRMIGDSYDSKVQTINKIGVANTIDDIATGSIFAYPVKGSKYGHIGIITGKNPNGTINIMDYNYKGDEQQREKLNVDPSEIYNLGGSISKPIVVDSTVSQPSVKGDFNKIYQILTEAGQADGVAKNNAKTLASSGKTIEQIKQEYPNKDDQYRIRDVTDSVSKAYESFNKSNTKLDGIMRILKDPNASGKSIEVALKSFVSAIDNTAAMAGEVAQARDAGLSDIDALQSRLIKIGSGKVKESIRKDIENTISQFHQGIQGAYDDYLDTQQGSLKTQYGDMWADKLNLYKRGGQMQSTNTPKISPDRQ